MAQLREHAIVLGGSMAGLLAARVLSDFYRTVTIVERDVFPDEPVNRRGVPQGRLIHAIQARGSQIMDELFSGFLDDLRSRPSTGVNGHGRRFLRNLPKLRRRTYTRDQASIADRPCAC